MKFDFKKIIKNFKVEGEFVSCEPYGEGHINLTFLLITTKGKYILQRINSDIFKNPEGLMENIKGVTEYLRKIIIENGGDPLRETLTLVPSLDGKIFYKDEEGNYFRVYIFIDDAETYQIVEKKEDFYNAASAFGKFQNMLADYPAKELFETIADFHHTPKRFEKLKKAVAEDKMGRLKEVEEEVEYALSWLSKASAITDALESGKIPTRVTHNDTKLNNVMIDNESGKGICVIDLDTVMPGSLLYDFGDSIRFGTNPAAEDEADLSKVYMDIELFEAYIDGFLSELKSSITKEEAELLPMSAIIMTLECGIRFLTDYLEGDTYFRIHYEKQNLNRTRTQLKLVKDMWEKYDAMNEIVAKYMN